MKYLIILVTCFFIVQFGLNIIILLTIQKHSVHPIYGNKVAELPTHCYPWDSCEETE